MNIQSDMKLNIKGSITTVAIILVLMVAVTGCKTIDPPSASNFANSVAAVKSQADDTLNGASALTLNESVVYAASQKTLKETNFVATPSSDAIGQWDSTLLALEVYAQNLSSLLSPTAVNNFDVAATNLANQFNQTAAELNASSKLPDSKDFTLFETAFTQVAGDILKAKEQATAVRVAAATDPEITNVCIMLANEIGADRLSSPGLRKTLNEGVWKPEEADLNIAFLKAGTPAEKLNVSQQYANLIAKREAEDQMLASLRHSLLLLGDAHHTLAQGQPDSIQADLNVIAGEIQHTKDLYNQFLSVNKK